MRARRARWRVIPDAAQQLAAADPAGVRKVREALPAKLRENGATDARAAGQLAHRAASRSSRPLCGDVLSPLRLSRNEVRCP